MGNSFKSAHFLMQSRLADAARGNAESGFAVERELGFLGAFAVLEIGHVMYVPSDTIRPQR